MNNEIVKDLLSAGLDHVSFTINHNYYNWCEVQFDNYEFNGIIILIKDNGGPLSEDNHTILDPSHPTYEPIRIIAKDYYYKGIGRNLICEDCEEPIEDGQARWPYAEPNSPVCENCYESFHVEE